MRKDLPLELRVSRLTVTSLRNLCDAKKLTGWSNLLKDDLVRFVIGSMDRRALEDFLTTQEEIYFVENMAKAIKLAGGRKIIDLDPESDDTIVNAVFSLRRSDGYEVYHIRFVNQTNEDVDTSCECVEHREKGYFCQHQMAVLVRCLQEGLFTLDRWSGPMTPEAEDLIQANVFKKKRPRK
ncbi:MAG: hypothetical protein AB1793_03335 [Candidatus Thermoplasmatota archaeon]